MPATGRLFACVRCRAQVIVCRRCDRGQIYCDGDCAQVSRQASLREAAQRYQRSRHGRRSAACAQHEDPLARVSQSCAIQRADKTRAIEQIAAHYGGRVVRTQVGQTYISEAMLEHDAVLGGEGSGGVTVPQVHLTHDSAAAVGLILEGLARSGGRLSDIVQQLPRLFMLKHNLAVEPNRLYSVLQDFRVAIERERLAFDLTDGIKIDLPQGWIHVRASNTESMIRIIVEAGDSTNAHFLLDWARDRLNN